MIKKLLSITLLALSFCLYAQYSPAVYDQTTKKYSYDFGSVLQDTTGATMKHNKDVTFTMTGFSKGDTYKIEVAATNSFVHQNGNCSSTESNPFTIVGASTGTVGDSAPTFTIRFNPKNVEVMKEDNALQIKELRKIACIASGTFVDAYGDKTATVKITRTPFCDNVVIKKEENSELTELTTLCPKSSIDEITLSGKSVEKIETSSSYTFSPAVYDQTTKKYSYAFGEVLQDTVGMVHNKDVTFTMTGLSKGDTYSLEINATNAFVHQNGNCSSTESNPFTIVGGSTGTVGDSDPTFTIRFNPKNVEVMKEDNALQIKNLKTILNCIASGTFVDAYGDKTAMLKITHTPFCDNKLILVDVKAEKNVVACPKSTIIEIALSGESVEKLTSTSIFEAKNAIIVAYPNPVSNILNFEGEGALYTVNGQLVGEGTNQINVSELNQGMYILQTTFGMTKIIKE